MKTSSSIRRLVITLGLLALASYAILWSTPYFIPIHPLRQSQDRGKVIRAINAVGQDRLPTWVKGFDGEGTVLMALCTRTDIEHIEEYLQLAVDQGVDINATDEFGRTALHYAGRYCNYPAINWLILNGADVSVRSAGGMSFLTWAMNSGCSSLFEMLKEVPISDEACKALRYEFIGLYKYNPEFVDHRWIPDLESLCGPLQLTAPLGRIV